MSGRIELAPYTTQVGRYETLELTVHVSAADLANPFAEAGLLGTFISDSGTTKTVRGFCDAADGSVWRLRFCPSEIGACRFRLTYQAPRMSGEVVGGFVGHDSRAHGFIRNDPDHPCHLVHDDGTHSFPAGKTAWRLGCSPHWREFIDQAVAYRMNVLRIGIEFPPVFGDLPGGDCWPWGGTRAAPDFSRLNLAQWQHWDEVIQYAAEQCCFIEPCIFTELSRTRPNPPIPDPDMERYWDYIIARWGAYPGVLFWELFNECTDWPNYQAYMARYFKTHDPYGRLVTTSGLQVGEIPFPEADWNDLIVPHFCVGSWHHLHGFYHDWARKLHTYGKPVYVDETGRAIVSQGNTDGVHRRKQYWIWAMAGDYANYHSEGGCYVDLTLEPGEEFWPALVNFWETTRWWEMNPVDERISAVPPGVLAAYCLWSPAETIVYAYTKASGAGVVSGTLALDLDSGRYQSRLYHPASGCWDEGLTIDHAGGTLTIACPAFRDDLVVYFQKVSS